MGGLLLPIGYFLTMNYFSHCTTWNGIPFTFLFCSTSYVVSHALRMLVIYVLLFIYLLLCRMNSNNANIVNVYKL